MNNYLTNNSFKKTVSGLTGLALLVNSAGCIGSINGYEIRPNTPYKFNLEAGTDPKGASIADVKGKGKKEESWYEDKVIVGGIILGAGAVGAIVYFVDKELKDDGKHRHNTGFGDGPGGGENGGGPGGN